MPITLVGTTGITTPGLTNSGNETITGTLNVGGLTPNVYPIVSGTAVASTSGTSIDFTSIPSWVRRITVMFSGVSTNGTSTPLIQIGAGSVTTSGYLGVGNATVAGGATSGTNFTTGFGVQSALAANILHGHMVLTNVTSNTWVASHAMGTSNGTTTMVGSGTLALGGTLDRVRITTVNGTDTFDAGTINLLWE